MRRYRAIKPRFMSVRQMTVQRASYQIFFDLSFRIFQKLFFNNMFKNYGRKNDCAFNLSLDF